MSTQLYNYIQTYYVPSILTKKPIENMTTTAIYLNFPC